MRLIVTYEKPPTREPNEADRELAQVRQSPELLDEHSKKYYGDCQKLAARSLSRAWHALSDAQRLAWKRAALLVLEQWANVHGAYQIIIDLDPVYTPLWIVDVVEAGIASRSPIRVVDATGELRFINVHSAKQIRVERC